MSYQPPKTLWEVSERLKFDEPLEPDDPRFVDTAKARGNFSFAGLLRRLGVDPQTLELKAERDNLYLLFCGHRGCGKSTELRRLRATLDRPDKFCVVFLDAVRRLDTNNLQYADVLFALAQQLLKRIEQEAVAVDPVFLTRLESWFKERIESHAATKDFAAEIKAGVSAESGIPFLGRLFASITNSIKVNSTYKDELRRVLKNSFSEFAEAFNQLIAEAEAKLKEHDKGRKLLFIVDGTDRLSGEDSDRFFIYDVHQLQLIQSNFIYCAPISLTYEGSQVYQNFSHISRLPMIKLAEKGDSTPLEDGYQAMRNMIYRRADKTLFDAEETVNYLIAYSGGHPRDLLRLLGYAFEFADGERFDRVAAEKAVRQLANDYRRILEAEDFRLLWEIDQAPADRTQNSPQARHLLFNLALLEYNDYWWQSHPVVRSLRDYRVQSKSAQNGPGASART